MSKSPDRGKRIGPGWLPSVKDLADWVSFAPATGREPRPRPLPEGGSSQGQSAPGGGLLGPSAGGCLLSVGSGVLRARTASCLDPAEQARSRGHR